MVLLGAIILAQTLRSDSGESVAAILAGSALPDSTASLKNGEYRGEGLNVMTPGESYTLTFRVQSREKASAGYRYVFESPILDESGQFTLKPGESKTMTLTLNPTEDDVYRYSHTEKALSTDTFDLSVDSFLGEKVVAEGEVEYAPVSVNVPRLMEVLNQNVTLEGLGETPYVTTQSLYQEVEDEMRVTNTTEMIYVHEGRLVVESESYTKVYLSKPGYAILKVYQGVEPLLEEGFPVQVK